jgi:hypothetical protein
MPLAERIRFFGKLWILLWRPSVGLFVKVGGVERIVDFKLSKAEPKGKNEMRVVDINAVLDGAQLNQHIEQIDGSPRLMIEDDQTNMVVLLGDDKETAEMLLARLRAILSSKDGKKPRHVLVLSESEKYMEPVREMFALAPGVQYNMETRKDVFETKTEGVKLEDVVDAVNTTFYKGTSFTRLMTNLPVTIDQNTPEQFADMLVMLIGKVNAVAVTIDRLRDPAVLRKIRAQA